MGTQADRRRLYELSGELVELDAAMSDPDLDVDAQGLLGAFFAQRLEALQESVGGYWYLIESLKADIAFAEQEEKRLRGQREILEARATSMKAALQAFFEANGIKQIAGNPYDVKLVGNGGLAPLEIDPDFTPDDIPIEFVKKDFHNTKIREALKAGRVLPFAKEGERGKHLEGKRSTTGG